MMTPRRVHPHGKAGRKTAPVPGAGRSRRRVQRPHHNGLKVTLRVSDGTRGHPLVPTRGVARLLPGGLALLLLLVAIPLHASAQQGGIAPTLTISQLSPTEQLVTVTPSAPGAANYIAIVKCTKPPGGVVSVTLSVQTSTGWPGIVSPPSLTFTLNGGSIQVAVIVSVPPGTNASSVGEVLVTGQGSYAGRPLTASSTGVIRVAQYFRIVPDSKDVFLELPMGGRTVLDLYVINRGNGLDSFSITILQQGSLAKTGWIVVLPSPTVDNVGPGETGKARITVQSPRPILDYKQGDVTTIMVRISSDYAETLGMQMTKDYLFSIFQKGLRVPGFDASGFLVALLLLGIAGIAGGPRRRR